MMKLWVLHGTYENEMFTSIHLTEKGCALAAIADVLDFLSITDEESALDAMRDMYAYTPDEKAIQGAEEPFEWDHGKMKEMSSKELWKIFADWTEISWDRMSDRSYYIDATPQMVQA